MGCSSIGFVAPQDDMASQLLTLGRQLAVAPKCLALILLNFFSQRPSIPRSMPRFLAAPTEPRAAATTASDQQPEVWADKPPDASSPKALF
jgi:hypothetical protein